MKTISKALAGTVAAGAMAMTSAPAFANDRHHKGGVDAGDIIAGAVILGGIAAVASAVGKKDRHRDGYRDRGYYGNNNYRGNRNRGDYNRGSYNNGHKGFRRGNNPRRAVERCIRTAERQARRFGGFRYADVTDIRDVDRTRYGFRVKGRIVVEGGRGYSDRGRFTCFVQGGNRPQVNFRKIRGLR